MQMKQRARLLFELMSRKAASGSWDHLGQETRRSGVWSGWWGPILGPGEGAESALGRAWREISASPEGLRAGAGAEAEPVASETWRRGVPGRRRGADALAWNVLVERPLQTREMFFSRMALDYWPAIWKNRS